jgi:hypothetical protein
MLWRLIIRWLFLVLSTGDVLAGWQFYKPFFSLNV